MAWDIDNTRPIYLQLMERIQLDIITGIYKPGDKLPSVRELATTAAVNPNTMQKALTELEHLALVYTKRTSGRFITEDIILLDNMKHDLAMNHIEAFLVNMNQLGFDYSEATQKLATYKKEEL
ncbi:MAG: GntR family transcriptional regulator [Eubacteriales bacterium]